MKFVCVVCFCISYFTAANLLPVADHCQPTSYPAAPSYLLFCPSPLCPLSQYISHPHLVTSSSPHTYLVSASCCSLSCYRPNYHLPPRAPYLLFICHLPPLHLPPTGSLLSLDIHRTHTYLLATYFHTYLLPTSDFLLTYPLPFFAHLRSCFSLPFSFSRLSLLTLPLLSSLSRHQSSSVGVIEH